MLNRSLFFLFFLINLNSIFSQQLGDDRYREDQIYISFYYNSLKNGFEKFKENKFSSSINFGFIRDIPLNKSGKFALGIGLGFGFNSYNNNLKINQINNNLNFEFLENQIEYDKNKFISSEIQIPMEIRLRNSSINTYKFWRLYAGIKYSRVLSSKYKFDSENIKYHIDDIQLNPHKLGLTLNIGFNTWNIGLYKAIRPFFDKKNSNLSTDLEEFKVGLIFYIL
tara:strand:+ start:2360 stop:3031 length:672 start_codon:yes stop_codon:yes gene_type:complete